MSKELITRSLSSVYKQILLDNDEKEDDYLKKEIQELASDSSLFSEEEIIENKKRLSEIEHIASHRVFNCYTDGAVLVSYDNEKLKEGKHIRAGAAFVVESEGKTLFENYFPIPKSYYNKDTNSHIAEYQALISCLHVLSIYHPDPSIVSVNVKTDSEVLAKQINLEYRVRDKAQKQMREEAFKYIRRFNKVDIENISRNNNQKANDLAKKSLVEDSFEK